MQIYDLPSTSLVKLKNPVLSPSVIRVVHIPLSVCSQFQQLYVITTHANDSLALLKPSA